MTTECRERFNRGSHNVVAAKPPHTAPALHDAAGCSKRASTASIVTPAVRSTPDAMRARRIF